MNIVVLDGYAMNPGDISWLQLKKLGACDIYDRTPEELVAERAQDADIILTNKAILTEKVMTQCPRLKYIGVCATGYNVVDVDAATERNIVVTNVPAYSTDSVAQMVFAHILNLTMHVAEHSQSAKRGDWARCKDFAYWNFPLIELTGLTLGLVGFGLIARAVTRIALSFDMRVQFYMYRTVADKPENVLQVDKESLFKTSDILSLHCPLTETTKNFVDAKHLGMMKKSAFVINTGRGPLVDEQALADALDTGQIAGAGLDVLSPEPPAPDNPLLTATNCYITPHIAWATKAARERLMKIVVENIKAFLDGSPKNVINPHVLKNV